MRSEKQVRAMLKKTRDFEEGGKVIEGMNGEMQAFEYVLEDRKTLF